MSEAKFFSPEDIIETQRKFMDSWFGLVQRSFDNDNPKQKSQASQPYNNWQDFFGRMTQAGRSYFEMAERFSGMSRQGLTMEQICQDWVTQVTRVFTQIQNQPMPNAADICKNPGIFWDLPQDTLNRTFSTLFPFPGDFFRAFRPEGLSRIPGDIHGHLDQFLSTPSLGYTRESQDVYKKYLRLMMEYQTALHEYNVAMSKVGMEAVASFQYQLAKEMNGEKGPASMKEVYDIWTQSAEEVYGAYIMTEEYTSLYGKLVNRMMEVKQQTAVMVDEVFEALNMPTRKEVNTLHQRVQELRRQCDFKLIDEIEQMKEQIMTLQQQLNGKKTAPLEVSPKKKGK